MPTLYIIIFICAVVVMFIIATVRTLLRKAADKPLETLREETSHDMSSYEKTEIKLRNQNEKPFVDIETDLENIYQGQYISLSQIEEFTQRYTKTFHEVYSLNNKLDFLNITPSDSVIKFISDYGAISNYAKKHNEKILNTKLDAYKDFFDYCLKYSLDKQQRRSIVSEADNCLVVSSAGSGKTSSIVGKVKYLTEIKGVAPEKILLISYTNKAASELTARMGAKGLKGYTFHKLAIDIIGQHTGIKPSICDNTDILFINIYHELLKDPSFKKNVIEYFIDYQQEEPDWEQQKNERRELLREQKDRLLKSVLPDMDGNIVSVKSEQEQKICFVLSILGVKFRYEEPYEHKLADEQHSQYAPDFSIYYNQDGQQKRIYLEHFGIDEHGLVPIWFAKDKNITYEEANKRYNDGITWKRAAHKKFGTTLITTSSADFHYQDIKEKLKIALTNVGVPIHEVTAEEIYNSIFAQGSKQEKAFIRLVSTFITLMKSSCKSINDIILQADRAKDERSVFIIKNIFKPVYEQYVDVLREKGMIDFTDLILQATKICRTSPHMEYDYIIVDEFQDISVDRYNFLKELRTGEKPAKLYCVGDDWQSIYRFSGSDMALFNRFEDFFGPTDINKIETTYRFGEPLVSLSSKFVQRNNTQIRKNIKPFNENIITKLDFCSYERKSYCDTIEKLIAQIPSDKSIYLLGRYSFDDYYLSFRYQSVKKDNQFFYIIGGREIEFLTVHKSKGLEADFVILLQCNKDSYGFPSQINDDPVLNLVLTQSDNFPFGEERRLFYVAITRAKLKTIVLYDRRFPSVFVNEFLHPNDVTENSYLKHPNANKIWTKGADMFLLQLYKEGHSVRYIADKMGRSQTAIIMRLGKLM